MRGVHFRWSSSRNFSVFFLARVTSRRIHRCERALDDVLRAREALRCVYIKLNSGVSASG